MARKEDTPQRVAYRKYEELHKEERKAKCGNFQTMIPREQLEQINSFLKKYRYTKVQLIQAGYKALLDEVAENDLQLAKIMDGYDDFFASELESMKKKE